MEYTIGQILKEAHEDFGLVHVDSELLLSRLLDTRREEILMHPELPISESQRDDFLLDCQRRSRGEPLAYLLGFREFYDLPFHVDRRVLIPRPETELLVDIALELCKEIESPLLCDIGTGSGCIAVAVAKNLPSARIVASDISDDALLVAKRNCNLHKVDVDLIQSDLMEEIADRSFDGIIANLPYIGRLEHNLVGKDVMEYEPNIALFGGDDGLDLITKLFLQITELPNKPKWVIGEMGFLQKDKLVHTAQKYFPDSTVECRQDLAGLDRAFIIIL